MVVTLFRRLGLFWLCAALTGCGFHLRGQVTVPKVMQSTYIDTQSPYTEMSRAISVELLSSGVKLAPQRDSAGAVLKLLGHRSDRRILSVGSSGKATEYELFEEVTFALESPAGEVLLTSQTLRMTRDFVFDESQLLGKVEEAQGIRNQMQHALARQILTRIQTSLEKTP